MMFGIKLNDICTVFFKNPDCYVITAVNEEFISKTP